MASLDPTVLERIMSDISRLRAMSSLGRVSILGYHSRGRGFGAQGTRRRPINLLIELRGGGGKPSCHHAVYCPQNPKRDRALLR